MFKPGDMVRLGSGNAGVTFSPQAVEGNGEPGWKVFAQFGAVVSDRLLTGGCGIGDAAYVVFTNAGSITVVPEKLMSRA